eukprot:3777799-Rhodomonas_salina.1
MRGHQTDAKLRSSTTTSTTTTTMSFVLVPRPPDAANLTSKGSTHWHMTAALSPAQYLATTTSSSSTSKEQQ